MVSYLGALLSDSLSPHDHKTAASSISHASWSFRDSSRNRNSVSQQFQQHSWNWISLALTETCVHSSASHCGQWLWLTKPSRAEWGPQKHLAFASRCGFCLSAPQDSLGYKKNLWEFVERLLFHSASINGNGYYWYYSSSVLSVLSPRTEQMFGNV